MVQLIDKSALIAEIDEIVRGLQKSCNPNPMGNMIECLAAAQIEVVNLIKDSINNLEVKEVDLNEEIEKCMKQYLMVAIGRKDFEDIAKHFFELGLKA